MTALAVWAGTLALSAAVIHVAGGLASHTHIATTDHYNGRCVICGGSIPNEDKP